MSPRPSSSKTAIVAGTLAGLLAAGLGAYYLWAQQPPAPAPAPAAVPAPLAAAAAPPAAADTPRAAAGRSKEQAAQALLALPELQAWSAWIAQDSAGAAHGALIEYESAPRTVNGKRYWQFSFVENSADAAHRWESFLVASGSEEILVEDTASDELLSLQRWRRERQPLQRRGAAQAPSGAAEN
ncbi:hypothetical protein [Janthinobacterium fluminis]|uniref:Uncharacterized protein n=1 Tax=Janthinobacterium fluminis TaxID=2987524 RepID=A0ABT5K1Y4_9BURK|nr:hypothetical protein [Janthinobacterium fluminis]MDC8758988.1 hypothetical protein [Janthinobacterium fluminis]